MPLAKPNAEDRLKLGAEINQIINQRFLISMTALTLFGLIVGWLVAQRHQVDAFDYIAMTMLLIFLFILYFYSHQLKWQMHLLAAYLIQTSASGWETDWLAYRDGRLTRFNSAIFQDVLFMVLGIMAGLFPFVMMILVGVAAGTAFGIALALEIFVLSAYIVLLYGMITKNWFAFQPDAATRWRTLDS